MTRFHYAWRKWEGMRRRPFKAGVSLHGHTWCSHEGLSFLPDAVKKTYVLPILLKWAERRYRRKWKQDFDYSRGYWTSPVSPEAAYELESRQIERLGLSPLVSLTDHEETRGCKDIVSLEWSAPYKRGVFHIGVHNLPQEHAPRISAMLREAARQPDGTDALRTALSELHAIPTTLVVMNHPLVDQGQIGHVMHAPLVRDFLARYGRFIHALEINAMQPWHVNRRVIGIADDARLPLIAGGDRHGFEPNGAINLTGAGTFSAFAREIREEKKSDILFMPQYREALALRYAHEVASIMADYPELGPKKIHWHDRVFYKCPDGVIRSLTEMMGNGRRSRFVRTMDVVLGTLGIMNRIAEPFAPAFARSKSKSVLHL